MAQSRVSVMIPAQCKHKDEKEKNFYWKSQARRYKIVVDQVLIFSMLTSYCCLLQDG